MNKIKLSVRVTSRLNVCESIRTIVVFYKSVRYHKINGWVKAMQLFHLALSLHGTKQWLEKVWTIKDESHFIQICFQFLSMTFSKARRTTPNYAIKAFPNPKLQQKLPPWRPWSFLNMPPQAVIVGVPLARPSTLHLIQSVEGGCQNTSLVYKGFLWWIWMSKLLRILKLARDELDMLLVWFPTILTWA